MSNSVKNKNHDTYFVPNLSRGLHILELLGASEKPMNISEIADALGINRSSAFRLVYTMTYMHFLEGTESGKAYVLGPRVANLGFAYLAAQDLVQVARRDLARLRDATGVSAHLAIQDGRDVLFLESANTRSPYASKVNIGSRRPVHATPLGWVLVSDSSKANLAELFRHFDWPRLTAHTPASLTELYKRAQECKRAGHVVSRGFLSPGGYSIAAPIHDRGGHVVAAIDISGPVDAFQGGSLEDKYLPHVLDAAARISAQLGFTATS
jgi:DNA-binding IclR family transcriptional regulator